MKLTGHILLASKLTRGCIFRFSEESFQNHTPHFFVVANQQPQNDGEIVLIYATSQVAKKHAWVRRIGIPVETLVEFNPGDYSFITKQTLFNCNNPLVHPPTTLIQKYDNNDLVYVDHLGKTHIEAICRGIMISPLVPKNIKNLVR